MAVQLDELFVHRNRLPLNRKERFYTGTVLPGIICTDGMRGLFALLRQTDLVVDFAPNTTNIQIFTEYDLRDAIRGDKCSPLKHLLSPLEKEGPAEGATQISGDTPDLVILIDQPTPLLIVIEAKLFNGETAKDLKIQIGRQRRYVVEPMKKILGDFVALQIALVPDSMKPDIEAIVGDPPAFQVITWEEIACQYKKVEAAAYWVRLLLHALGRERHLRADSGSSGDLADKRLTAAAILDAHGQPHCRIRYVGAGGTTWPLLQDDIEHSGGTKRLYAVSYKSEIPSKNYIGVALFVDVVRNWMKYGVPGQQPYERQGQDEAPSSPTVPPL